MAELVDASDSKSDSARSAGSIPARGTILFHSVTVSAVFWLLLFAHSAADLVDERFRQIG
jgi:hypothetical protein